MRPPLKEYIMEAGVPKSTPEIIILLMRIKNAERGESNEKLSNVIILDNPILAPGIGMNPGSSDST